MARGRDPEDIARMAWTWLDTAETAWRKSKDGSPEELQAIQTMSLAAMAAMTAQQMAQRT
ncbi:hypothetical protein GCM10010174_80790 [Kutzneria viridogrisea]|uniref:Uncharacterized protein n=1 Tax=Kutzneria viridogrisea TaxID=47990 RepID=A0ABR6BYZ2_9PSEU|nr:hypothetical protein [Kutzneria viridogrisea]